MEKRRKTEILLRCLAQLHQSGPVSLESLVATAGCSRRTMFRLLDEAKVVYGVELLFVRDVGYRVEKWGVLNADAVVAMYARPRDNGER
ncbi:hypothetical protein [Cupriavidus malaysiensis]|uniref:HTH domain-containing protein n=1 Tax=Cupriavidus malaysiensis TaxID=367825 RepID=A0ABN4TX21_9BURK|nr:hypothetical protein [Cupriavidus malaysiensis]AOZ11109.1 hypothetical protein BKK80_34685 [Cupriavidus malaysiensis]